MNSGRTHFRQFWLIFVALHISVVGLAELAEAHLAIADLCGSDHSTTQIHKRSTLFHPAQCAVCHFLNSPAREAGNATPAYAAVASSDTASPEHPSEPSRLALTSAALPRAPPNLS